MRKYFDILNATKKADTSFYAIPQPVNCIFDTTFFKRSFGVMVFRVNHLETSVVNQKYQNIHHKFVESETLINYLDCLIKIDQVCLSGYKSFTVDGRAGVIKILNQRYLNIPVQMCIFHQVQIVLRYTTRNPKNDCGKDLKKFILTLKSATKQEFTEGLNELLTKYEGYLGEYTINPITNRKQYIHRNHRSAFRSIKRHLKYLFTFQDYPQVNIPPTTNSCDGSFGHWKAKVKLHRGISLLRKQQIIDEFLKPGLS